MIYQCSRCHDRCSEPVEHLLDKHPTVRPTMKEVWTAFRVLGGRRKGGVRRSEGVSQRWDNDPLPFDP